MTRDYIIKMALECGFKLDEKGLYKPYYVEDITPVLERFAALVAAAERERCAMAVEVLGASAQRGEWFLPYHSAGVFAETLLVKNMEES